MNCLATFCGQAGPCWLEELRFHFQKHDQVAVLVKSCVLALQDQITQASNLGVHPQGFDVLSWIEHPDTAPSEHELSFAALSYPGITLTQLSVLQSTLCQLNCSLTDLGSRFAATTGHSQGYYS